MKAVLSNLFLLRNKKKFKIFLNEKICFKRFEAEL